MYRFLNENIENTIEKYIDRVLTESQPQLPLWNVESIKQGKKPAWNYIDGCMLTGLLSLYEETKQQRLLDFVESFVDFYIDDSGKILGYDPQEYNIDNISAGRVLFDLYRILKKEKYKKAIDNIYAQIQTHPRTAEGSFWHKKIYPNQVWLDGLYMGQVFYTRYETEFNNGKNYSDIINQFEIVRKRMFDEKKKLYKHGYDQSKKAFWADKKTGQSKGFWLRSMGWYIASLVDVVSYLKPDAYHEIARISALFTEAVEGVLGYLDFKSRMLYQVVDCAGKEGNYPETSGSALIAYAVMKAVRCNIVTSGYLHTGRGIFNGIAKKYLTEENGKLHLGGICLVAGLGPENNRRRDGSYEYYISEPVVQDDAKGLGPFLMAYSEIKRVR